MIGKTISHYTILTKLGEGGMGVVYKAEDQKLDRTVALKFLAPHIIPQGDEMTRFIQEAKAAAALNHPNICTVYEIDEVDGNHFIAMENIEGQILSEMISAGPLKVKEIIDIVAQLAEGLGAAHGKDIVHRDIKPANIAMSDDGRIKIMDFGLAHRQGNVQLTRDGSTLGTAAYMSPEQTEGKRVDCRTDIWSLGAVMYEMISGKRPFEADYEQAVLYSIVHKEPESLSSVRSGIPPALEMVVTKCLAKDPDERYQSMSDVADDLRGLSEEVGSSGAGSSGGRAGSGRSGKRADTRKANRPVLWISALAIIAMAIFVFKVSDFEFGKKPSDEGRTMIVVLPFENLGGPEDMFFAEGMTEEITSRLAAIRDLGVISRTSAVMYRGSEKSISEIGAELGVEYILEGTVRWDKKTSGESSVLVTPQLIRVSDDSHIWADRYEEKFEAVFDVQAGIAEKVAASLNIALTGFEQDVLNAKSTGNFIAYQAYLRGCEFVLFGHRSESDYRAAMKFFEQAITLDQEFALAYAKLSQVHRSLYFFGYDHTPERLELAREAVDKALELQPDLVEAHRELGYYYYHGLLDYDRALQEFSLIADDYPSDAKLLEDIGLIWRRQGHFEQALGNFEAALETSPVDVGLVIEMSNTLGGLRRYDEAVEFSDRAIAMAPQVHWPYLLKSVYILEGSGDVEAARTAAREYSGKNIQIMKWIVYYMEFLAGNYEAAIESLRGVKDEVLYMQGRMMPVSVLKGNVYFAQGRSSEATAEFETALLILEGLLARNTEDPRIHSALGMALAGLGRKDEAIRAGEYAVELYPVTKDAMLSADRMFDLALICSIVGDHSRAIDVIRSILDMNCVYSIHHFLIDPLFKPLHSEPEFKLLVKEHYPDKKG